MVELAAVGPDEFVIGFQLAGIKNTVVANENPTQEIRDMLNSDAGIVIVDEMTIQKLDEYTREEVEDSVRPVFIVVSDKAEDEGLRKMIIKSIGVDLWEK